jgi:type III secretion protein C
LLFVLASFLVASVEPARSAEPKWPKEPYKYLIIDQDLRDVLREFGRNIGVPVQISDGVAKRRVRNDTAAVASAREFLQRLCDAYGLVWYFDGTTLYVSDDAEIRAELFNVGSLDASDFIRKLESLGVADPRFPIRASGKSGVISVSGPPPLRQQVRKALEAMDKPQVPKEVIVFRGGR